MGWNSANEIFDPVARKAQELGLTGEQRTELLSVLIDQLQQGDWDTEDESLDEFKDDEAVVEAFRRNKIYVTCREQMILDDGGYSWCEREKGERGHKDGKHQDYKGRLSGRTVPAT